MLANLLTFILVYQLKILLLAVGALQGALISLVILRRHNPARGRMYFVLFLLAIGLQLTFRAVEKGWLWQHAQVPYLFSYSLPFLIGPLLYLFVKVRTSPGHEFSSNHLLHGLPFLIHFINTASSIFFNYSILPAFLSLVFPHPSLEMLSLLIYSLLSFRMISGKGDVEFRGELKTFVGVVTFAEAVIILTIALMVRNIETFPDVRLLFVVLTGIIYWISYKLFAHPTIYFPTSNRAVPLKTEPVIKYSHSGLRQEEAERIAGLIQKALNDRIFIEMDISIDTVSKTLQVPKHHLSRVINEKFGMTFVELVNQARLREAQERLTNPKYGHHTIYAIALDSGFSSVSSFNAIFKRHFQCTPSAFRDLYKKKKTA